MKNTSMNKKTEYVVFGSDVPVISVEDSAVHGVLFGVRVLIRDGQSDWSHHGDVVQTRSPVVGKVGKFHPLG
jgi:hypothetical protein